MSRQPAPIPEAERWRRIDRLMGDALALPAAARAAWLADACGEDEELRQEVESLLSAHQQAGEFLENTVADAAEQLEQRQAQQLIGQRIGPYRVLEEIGRGGMSVVYLAARDDDEFDRRVAIKVIKRGMDSAEIERRFRIERQILADLQHPNIARLYDGGTTPDGLPCFVMEHIEGQPIDLYAKQHRLSIEQRLELFRQVCAAVEHAHRNLVVHRDLKPSNVLVNSEGAPKLLDFGIAKLLAAEPPAAALPTAPMARAMTPAYASPEQIRGVSVTTASDVYSLGVMLYELLTGRLPYQLDQLSAGQIERLVNEHEPARPSIAVTRAPPAVLARRAAERGCGRPERLRKRLSGDLDNIVLEALRKEPERRYPSVARLSDDLRRHLVRLPVSARPDTVGYRAGKFVRRHRTAVVAAALILLAILGGSLATAVQARRAVVERERAIAERERAVREREHAEQVSRFLRDLFRLTDQSAAEGASVTASELLDLGVEEIHRDLAGRPKDQSLRLVEVAKSYRNLGLYERSADVLERALALNLRSVGESHSQTAETFDELGRTASKRGSYTIAASHFERALGIRRGLFGPLSLEAGESLNNLGLLQLRRGTETAEPTLREAYQIYRRELGPGHLDTASTLNNLATALGRMGRLDEAESSFREALEIRRRELSEDSDEVVESLNNLATLLFKQGRLIPASELFQEVLARRQRRLGENHPRIAPTLNNLAKVLFMSGRAERAEPLYRRALKLKSEHLGKDHPGIVVTLTGLAASLRQLDRPGEAAALYRQALEITRRSYPPTDRRLAEPLIGLGELYLDDGEPSRAEPLLREAVELRGGLEAGDWRRAEAESAYGATLLALDRRAAGEPLVRQAYQVLSHRLGEQRPETRRARSRLAALDR